MKIKEDGTIDFGNPKRRKRSITYHITKKYYNHNNGDILHIYCVQKFNSKTLDFFVEVCPKDKEEYVITAASQGKQILTHRECKNIVKEILK